MKNFKQNWFNTLNESLESEGLIEFLPNGAVLQYSQILRTAYNGLFLTITRDNNGMYERPIFYKTQCENFLTVSNYN